MREICIQKQFQNYRECSIVHLNALARNYGKEGDEDRLNDIYEELLTRPDYQQTSLYYLLKNGPEEYISRFSEESSVQNSTQNYKNINLEESEIDSGFSFDEEKIISSTKKILDSQEWQLVLEGNRNDALVAALQQNLLNLGYDLGRTGVLKNGIDGDYGPLTEEAVNQFNQAQEIRPRNRQESNLQR